MEKRDYLIDQIEQLGQVLAKIFSKLMGFKSQGKMPEAIEMTSISLKTELDLDLVELAAIDAGDFVLRMKEDTRFNYANLEILADILYHIADDINQANPDSRQDQDFYRKSLKIYNYLNERDLTYSFERQAKIEHINSILL